MYCGAGVALQDMRFSHCTYWRFKSSGMLLCVHAWIFSDVL